MIIGSPLHPLHSLLVYIEHIQSASPGAGWQDPISCRPSNIRGGNPKHFKQMPAASSCRFKYLQSCSVKCFVPWLSYKITHFLSLLILFRKQWAHCFIICGLFVQTNQSTWEWCEVTVTLTFDPKHLQSSLRYKKTLSLGSHFCKTFFLDVQST